MNITDKVGVLNNDFRLSIIDMKVNNVALWQYIFKTRIKELTLLILLLITPVAVPAVYIIFGIIGMSVGMVVRRKCNEYGDKRNVCIHSDDISTLYNICHYYIHTNIHMGNQQRSYVNINIRKIAMALLVSLYYCWQARCAKPT